MMLHVEKPASLPFPVIRKVGQEAVNDVYRIIKLDIQDIIAALMEEILNDPEKEHMVARKKYL